MANEYFRFLLTSFKVVCVLGVAIVIAQLLQIAPGYSGTDDTLKTSLSSQAQSLGPDGSMSDVLSGEPAEPATSEENLLLVSKAEEADEALAKSSDAVDPSSQATDLKVKESSPVFDIASVDRLRLRVWGYPDMNGEYAIAPDMTMSVAVLGRIKVGDITPSQLEEYLSEKLSDFTRREVRVSVEVARYRPYFITGHISNPGAIDWRPGLTLIQAISLGGGLSRSAVGSDSTQMALLRDPANLRLVKQAQTRRKFAIAQLARLEAEKQGLDRVETTDVVDQLIYESKEDSREALQTFVARQNTLLDEQRILMKSRISGLEREKEAAVRELEAAETQEKAIQKQVNISQKLTKSLERLKQKRLVANARFLEQRSSLIDNEVRYSETQSLVARARARVSALTREISTIQLERRSLLNDRIETLEREIAQFEVTLAGFGSLKNLEEPEPPVIDYHIARKDETGVQTIVATLFTEILPGDVVIVSSSPRSTIRSSSIEGVDGGKTKTAASTLDRMQRLIESTVAISSSVGSERLARSPAAGRN